MSEAPSNPVTETVTQSEKQILNFDLDTVREIAQLLGESQLGEICIETTSEDAAPARLLLRREPSTPVAPIYIAPPEVAPEVAAGDEALESEGESTPSAATTNVSSPAVGIFRPAKTAVKEGDSVKAGQTIAIVESMRVPNEVVSSVAGQVVEMRAQDGQGVEYGQILFVIEDTP